MKKVVNKKPQPKKVERQPPAISLYPLAYPSQGQYFSTSEINNMIYENFSYSFQNNRLVSSITNSAYAFSDNYDALGTFVALYTRSIMLEVSLVETWLPENSPSVPVYHSHDLRENPKLLVLIQGKGEVRPGQWSRKICINDNLEQGTMLPYIMQAFSSNYAVLILNPNLRINPLTGEAISINSTSQAHCNFIWENIVKHTKASHVFIAAHSFGGVCSVNLVKNHSAFFKKRVKAIALLDSVHKVVTELDFDQRKYFQNNAKNWKKSQKPLGSPLPSAQEGCVCVSAGDPRHEYTSASAISDVFAYFNLKSK